MTGDTSGKDYSYSDGILTVNDGADIAVSMASGATGPTSDRIVVAEDATATITLNGVNITGSAYDPYAGTKQQSAVDLSENATLTLNLSESSQNTLIGGAGGTSSGVPGIHVPSSASLVVCGSGSLSVAGGSSSHDFGGSGIGGISNAGYDGEACGTVVILSTGTVTITGGNSSMSGSNGTDIGGGQGSPDGGNGQGIRPSGNSTYTVWGDLTLPCNITIPDGVTVVVPNGTSLTVPQGVTLTNNGTIRKENGGSFINDGTVTGQQPADDRYSIDYAEETITIAEGYEVYTEATEGAQIQSGGSITAYIGESLYLQKTDSGTSGRTVISIPDRPEAPTLTSASIDYSGEKLNFPPDVTETTLEYAPSQFDSNWQDVPDGAALSEMGWNGNTAKTYYFRTGATATSFASSEATTFVTAPARPAKPAEPETVDVTSDSITIEVVSGQEYRLGSSGAWETLTGTTGSDGKTVYTYANLTPGTSYTIETRTPTNTTIDPKFASHPASVTVTTKFSPADPPEMTCEVTADSITLSYGAPWQYQTADGGWVSVEGAKTFTDLEAATEHAFTVRVAETETAEASKVGTVTVWTAYAAPTGVQGGVNQISGVTADMEYSADGGKTWVACQNGSVTGLPAGEYLVRRMGSGAIPASSSVTVTVAQSAPPYVPPTPSSPDWDDVTGDIADAVDGGRVVVDMGGETVLPGEVLGALAGRDVTLVLEMGEGVAWGVWGGDVPEGTSFSDLDMGVEMGTDGIPVDVTNLVTGEAGVVQVTLAHDGPFGFGLTLVAPLGERNDGLFANLYRYDEEAGSLRYECTGVGDDGVARLRLDHASQWAIALDTRSHALPFADASEGQWYSEAVRRAWLSGLMTGYADGSGLFGVGDELTRAQMAAVLHNAAGRPEAEVAGLPSDCDESAWYAGAVAWALSEGLFHGYGDGSAFGPDDPLIREQAAAVLRNAAGGAASAADLSPFSDASEVSEWAEDAVSWAVSEGVLRGHAGLLEPARACTRAEAAALVTNLAARG